MTAIEAEEMWKFDAPRWLHFMFRNYDVWFDDGVDETLRVIVRHKKHGIWRSCFTGRTPHSDEIFISLIDSLLCVNHLVRTKYDEQVSVHQERQD